MNTHDNAGGAARIASDLHEGFLRAAEKATLAVGFKTTSDSEVRVIDNDRYRARWSRYLLAAQAGVRSSRFDFRGKGRLEASIGALALRDRDRALRSGLDYLDYPATWHPDEWAGSADVLHFHNLHGGYFDLRALPFLTARYTSMVTLHDAWLLSGHCAHSLGCEKWKSGCGGCPDLTIPPPVKRDRTDWNWRVKRDAFAMSSVNVATPSQWLMNKVSASLLAPAITDARVVPNGVDLAIFRPGDRPSARLRLGLPVNSPTAVFSAEWGRGNPFKDFETVEVAAFEAARELERELVLVVIGGRVGGSSERRGHLRVEHIPYLTDRQRLADYLRAADLCVHAAHAESFSLSLTEAMACGTPAVSVRVDAIPEVVEDGVTGILVAPGDTESFARAIVRVLGDREFTLALGAAARERAVERFGLDRMVRAYRDWYHEAVEARMRITGSSARQAQPPG